MRPLTDTEAKRFRLAFEAWRELGAVPPMSYDAFNGALLDIGKAILVNDEGEFVVQGIGLR